MYNIFHVIPACIDVVAGEPGSADDMENDSTGKDCADGNGKENAGVDAGGSRDESLGQDTIDRHNQTRCTWECGKQF